MNKYAILISASIIAAACEPIHTMPADNDYWQRISASEAAHIRGPSAQSILNRNLAHCVAELEELNRLGELDAPQERKTLLAPPEIDNHILNNQADYDDFERCMANNGWERAMTLNRATADRAEDNYMRNHVKYRDKYLGKDALYNTDSMGRSLSGDGSGDFDNLNE